ncbi:hypothetical protein QBC35DRAFT_548524, partial [Podospora australis]
QGFNLFLSSGRADSFLFHSLPRNTLSASQTINSSLPSFPTRNFCFSSRATNITMDEEMINQAGRRLLFEALSMRNSECSVKANWNSSSNASFVSSPHANSDASSDVNSDASSNIDSQTTHEDQKIASVTTRSSRRSLRPATAEWWNGRPQYPCMATLIEMGLAKPEDWFIPPELMANVDSADCHINADSFAMTDSQVARKEHNAEARIKAPPHTPLCQKKTEWWNDRPQYPCMATLVEMGLAKPEDWFIPAELIPSPHPRTTNIDQSDHNADLVSSYDSEPQINVHNLKEPEQRIVDNTFFKEPDTDIEERVSFRD